MSWWVDRTEEDAEWALMMEAAGVSRTAVLWHELRQALMRWQQEVADGINVFGYSEDIQVSLADTAQRLREIGGVA